MSSEATSCTSVRNVAAAGFDTISNVVNSYTSIFLLQALADNEEEERRWAEERSSNSCTCEGVDWSVDAYFARRSTRPPPVLDVVDNMEHEATTAHLVLSAAKELKIESYLKVHVADAYDLNASSFDGQFDLVWLDGISTDERFAGLFKTYWELIKDGGYAAVHSTLTNNLSKAWLSKVHAEKKAEEATCVARFEVKPWDGDADLSLLKDKVRGHDLDNLAQVTWLERSLVEEVGYGIKKLILFARIDEAAGASAEVVADYLSETFEEEIQSVDVELGDDADAGASWGNFSVFGFLEPHKTRQNSFSLFQKRGLTYAEPSYSWTP